MGFGGGKLIIGWVIVRNGEKIRQDKTLDRNIRGPEEGKTPWTRRCFKLRAKSGVQCEGGSKSWVCAVYGGAADAFNSKNPRKESGKRSEESVYGVVFREQGRVDEDGHSIHGCPGL